MNVIEIIKQAERDRWRRAAGVPMLDNIYQRMDMYHFWLRYKYVELPIITSAFLDAEQMIYLYERLGVLFTADGPNNDLTFNQWLAEKGLHYLIF